MKHLRFVPSILAILWVIGCQPAPTEAPKPTLNIAFPSEADLGDVPALMALDLLQEQGYEVKETFYAEPPLAVEAVSQGNAQFSFGSIPTHWAAIQKGANVTTIMEELRDTWLLVASSAIKQCSDIAGKKLAISSPGAGSAALTRAYIAKNCPGTEPEIVLISGSQNRAAALLAGEIDLTPIELPDVQQLQQEAPDKVRVLATFSDDLPDLIVTGIYVNTDFAKANPEVVRDYLKALLTVYKQIEADPTPLVKKASEILKMDAAEVEPLVKTHVDFHAWPVDGGLTEDRVKSTLAFLVSSGDMDGNVAPGDVADLSYLQAVLGSK